MSLREAGLRVVDATRRPAGFSSVAVTPPGPSGRNRVPATNSGFDGRFVKPSSLTADLVRGGGVRQRRPTHGMTTDENFRAAPGIRGETQGPRWSASRRGGPRSAVSGGEPPRWSRSVDTEGRKSAVDRVPSSMPDTSGFVHGRESTTLWEPSQPVVRNRVFAN